jgi:tRNA U34 2-thiouridine synthase MnmA/TrmU
VDDSVKVLVKYDELFAVCFQSMGICFIGERNFEDFILEVRK